VLGASGPEQNELMTPIFKDLLFGLLMLGSACALPAHGADTSAVDCMSLNIRLPDVPSNAVNVTAFGAKPDDDDDDTETLQAAFNALKPGQTLVFAPGRYLQRKSVEVTVPNTTLIGTGATLHATNPDDQSLVLGADGTSLYGLTLTADTEERRSGNRHHRIRIIGQRETPTSISKPIYDTLVARVRIQAPEGATGAHANSASGAGIYLARAHRFVIANNQVSRSLADGIHMTSGSRDGVVIGNTVRENGDDMIAVVSYLRPTNQTVLSNAKDYSPRFDELASVALDRNILIANNDVAGNYWGRGITVVGGADVTIRGNAIHDMAIGTGAGILLAREQGYFTFGVENVLIENNRLQSLHAAPPRYTVKSAGVSQQGAIELHSFMYTDERADALLADRLAIQRVLIRGNEINGVRTSGVRTGVRGIGASAPKGATTPPRPYETGVVKDVAIVDNRFQNTPQGAISLTSAGTDKATVHCAGNLQDGKKPSGLTCNGPMPTVTGASLSCDAMGRVLRR